MRRHDTGDKAKTEAAVWGALMDELYESEEPHRRIIQVGASLAPSVIGGTGAGFFIHLFLLFFPFNRWRPRRLLPPCQSK